MGKYNFDEIIDRHGTSCNKWEYNIPEDVIPMWVADMDFAAAPEIREAMQKRLDHPVYGYTHHSKELKDAIVSWVGRRYHWDIQSEWLGFLSLIHILRWHDIRFHRLIRGSCKHRNEAWLQ